MATKSKLKLPPQNLEAEQSVLGALMIDKDAIVQIADTLSPQDFYHPHNAQIYEAIMELYEKRHPIDILSLTAKLKEKDLLKELGGSTYLSKLVDSVPTSSHIGHYAQIVKEKKILRDLINASADITEKAFNAGGDLEGTLDEIEQRIFSISQRSIPQKFTKINEELPGAYERIEKMHRGERTLGGLGTGFYGLDNILSGLRPSDLIVIGARPSLGKTAFVLDIARHVATKEGQPVGIFSLEMSKDQIIDRIIAAEAQVPLWHLRTGRLNDETDFQLIQQALDSLSKASLFIDDSASPNILQMRSMARRLQAEHGLSLLIVDYLQLIQPRTHSDNMVTQVTEISRNLKALAKELNVPVLAVSQLSRAVDQRDRKVPRLSDLRESGCLTGDSLIMRADTGELVTIKSLAERESQNPIPVYALDENWKLAVKPIIKAFPSGKKMTYQLRTQSGRLIKASANHPFRKLDGWRRLDQLKEGDRVAIPRSLPTTHPKNILSDEELTLHAHLLGDGCILPNQPFHYTSGDFENILTVRDAADKLFNIKGRIVKQKNWWHVYLPSPYRLTHKRYHPVTLWFERLGIQRVRSWGKEISPLVFASSREKIAFFLRHLWATDGNISWKLLSGRKPSAAIYYGSTSWKLASQVQHLLLRLGIQGVLRTVPQKKQAKIYRPMHCVAIQGKENQLRFLRFVGCAGERGKIIPDLVSAMEKIIGHQNLDFIPKEAWKLVVEPAKIAAGLGWREVSTGLETAYCGSTLFKTGIGRDRMTRLANIFSPYEGSLMPTADLPKGLAEGRQNGPLDELARSDVYWDEIVKIAPLGEEETYDATVEGLHNFIANDIIVHNSIEQDADIVLFLYRADRDKANPNPEEQNTAEIIVAKHRNGPLGSVQLKFDPEKASFRNIDKTHASEV